MYDSGQSKEKLGNRSRAARLGIAAFCLATAAGATPHWQPLPPFGGPVSALAAPANAPGVLYAGTVTAGALRSRDGGTTWVPSAGGPDTLHILDLAVDVHEPSVVFAAAQTASEEGAGVLRSLDGGAHWSPANSGLGGEHPLFVRNLAADGFGQGIFAATDDGLFHTIDRGESWTRSGLAGSMLLAVAIHPFRPATLLVVAYQAPRFVVLASSDYGANWRPSEQGLDESPLGGAPAFDRIAFNPVAPDLVYAYGNGWNTHLSRDGGASWTSLGEPLSSLTWGPAGSLFGAPYNQKGVVRSLDQGLTWSRPGRLDDSVQRVLFVSGELYAAGKLGVWSSADNGAHWRPSSRGLSARTVSDLTASDAALFASFSEGVLASGDGGGHWHPVGDTSDPGVRIYRVLSAVPGALYVAASTGQSPFFAVLRSADHGATWTQLPPIPLSFNFSSFAVDPRHPATLYAGASFGSGSDQANCHLARSRDGGNTWHCLSVEVSADFLTVEPATSTAYFLASGSVFTVVGGSTQYAGHGLPVGLAAAIAFDPQHRGAIFAATSLGVYVTGNGGRSWTRSSRGIPAGEPVQAVAADPNRADTFYAATPGKVYRSRDRGRSWALLGAGLPADVPITGLLSDPGDPHRLYAVAAGHGIYRMDPS